MEEGNGLFSNLNVSDMSFNLDTITSQEIITDTNLNGIHNLKEEQNNNEERTAIQSLLNEENKSNTMIDSGNVEVCSDIQISEDWQDSEGENIQETQPRPGHEIDNNTNECETNGQDVWGTKKRNKRLINNCGRQKSAKKKE